MKSNNLSEEIKNLIYLSIDKRILKLVTEYIFIKNIHNTYIKNRIPDIVHSWK